LTKNRDKYYKAMEDAFTDSMELLTETIDEEEYTDGADQNTRVKTLLKIALKLYESRMFK